MAQWLSDNLSTVIVGAILVLVVAFVIFIMIRDRRTGRKSCCHDCAGCAMSRGCRKKKAQGD